MRKAVPDSQLDRWFAYHPPSSPEVVAAHETVRAECRRLAQVFNDLLPEGPDKETALRKVREAMVWANTCIAVQQRLYEDG